jgi:Mg-chelatase subunit ChlI
VLIRGEKGTAKSTAVRALASLLPEITAVEGCSYGCDPADSSSLCTECRERSHDARLPRISVRPRVIDLPVSATEDRLVGTLDFERCAEGGGAGVPPRLLPRPTAASSTSTR